MSNTKAVYAPFDGRHIADVPMVDAEQAETMLQEAYELSRDRDRWLSTDKRVDILRRAEQIMQGQVEELTRLMAEEGGKPYKDSKVEALRAIDCVRVAIETLRTSGGEEIPMGGTNRALNRLAFTQHEPIGVVMAISAFNHPFNLIAHQVAPAVAVGCPVIVKPASSTPRSCFKFVEILREAGLPEEWCRVAVCNNQVAQALATDKRTSFLTFIGSARVGWMLKSKLAPGTRCALEHGGVAPVIMEADADIEDALPLLAVGGMYHAGQVCVSVQRLYVHNDICERVAGSLVEIVNNMKVGDPLDPDTDVGPLITTADVDRVHEWVHDAVAKGGKLLCGGEKISDTCYAPTIVLNPPDDCTLSTDEVFGPVICIYGYDDRRQAIDRANALDVEFQASVFTKNLDIALDTSRRLNAAAVMINDHTAFRVDWMPFAGHNVSGYGTGGIPYTMEDMQKKKMTVIRSKMI